METFIKVVIVLGIIVLVLAINAAVWHVMRAHGCHPTFYHQGIAWSCP